MTDNVDYWHGPRKYKVRPGAWVWRYEAGRQSATDHVRSTREVIYDEQERMDNGARVDYFKFELPKSAYPWVAFEVYSLDVEEI